MQVNFMTPRASFLDSSQMNLLEPGVSLIYKLWMNTVRTELYVHFKKNFFYLSFNVVVAGTLNTF